MTTSSNGYDHWSRIIPALAASGVGAMFYNILPLYIGAAQDAYSLTSFQAGTLGTAFAGYNLATISAFFWIQRVNWRVATLFWLIITFIGLIAGLFATSFQTLLLTVLISGMGFAALYGMGTRVLADTSDPSRWYGVKVGVEVMPGAVLLIVLPATLLPSMGISGVIWGMIGMSVLLSFALITMPEDGAAVMKLPLVSRLRRVLRRLFRAAVGRSGSLWHAPVSISPAASAIWSFLERMGASGGLSTAEIGNVLALTLLFATLGSFLTGWLGSRFQNINPFLISVLILIASLVLLADFAGPGQYATAACGFFFCLRHGRAVCCGRGCPPGSDGRFVILSVPAIGFGAMIGPAVGGL